MRILMLLTVFLFASCAQLTQKKVNYQKAPKAKAFNAKQAKKMYYNSPKFQNALGYAYHRIKSAADNGQPYVSVPQNNYYVCQYISKELRQKEFKIKSFCQDPQFWEHRRIIIHLQ